VSTDGEQIEEIGKAMVAIVGERGYEGLTLELLLARSGVDEATFFCHFEDLEDCYCQVAIEMGEELSLRVADAFAAAPAWRDRVRLVAYAMLEWLREDLDRARFTVVEAFAAGERTQAARDDLFRGFYALIDLGRQEMTDPDALTPATAEALGGTIFNHIRTEIEAENCEALEYYAPRLMYSVVLPYLGPGAAAEELEMPPPAPETGSRAGGGAA
jgi:AcrR family transcriptional regulator